MAYASPLSEDGHSHELVMLQDHPWSYADLMAQPSGAPAADGFTLLGSALKAGGTKHVVYLDTLENPHIHSLMLIYGSAWRHADIIDLTDAPPLA